MSECLLIVDVQVGFIDEATKHIPKLVTELQKKYRYVYVTRFYNKEDSFYRQLVKWNRFDKGSDDFQLAFKPLTDAVIIDKSIYSCVNSNFLQELNNNKIDSVDVCGIDTDICVTKCAVDLFEASIVPRVLGRYCGIYSGEPAAQVHALDTLKRFIGKEQVMA